MSTRLPIDSETLADLCRRHRIRRLSLFGSYLKGTARRDSDIDLLAEFEPDADITLFDMARIEIELSGLLGGRKVDLRTQGELSRYFRDEVVRTAKPLYVAGQDVDARTMAQTESRLTMNPALVSETVECLRRALPAGSQIIVFGSYARGDARADSDLDLLVVEPEVADHAAETVRLSVLLGRRLLPADVVVMSRSTYESERAVPNTLAYRAAREGKVLELAG
ncbi:MAG: hypothetical protein BroJett031_19740 [Betaproteobacteria bacterium]|nr:MAG: hypothetical protein BroJett031_19740 [Betaproteobacteria bacterium]